MIRIKRYTFLVLIFLLLGITISCDEASDDPAEAFSYWDTTIIDFTTATDSRIDWVAPGETESAFFYAVTDASESGISTLNPSGADLKTNLVANNLFSFTMYCGDNPGSGDSYVFYEFPFAPLDDGSKVSVDLSQFTEIVVHYKSDADLKLIWRQETEAPSLSAVFYVTLKARADFGAVSYKLELDYTDGFKQPDWATSPERYSEYGYYFEKTEAQAFALGLNGSDDAGTVVHAEFKGIGFK